jgi:peptidylprolyl isomerase
MEEKTKQLEPSEPREEKKTFGFKIIYGIATIAVAAVIAAVFFVLPYLSGSSPVIAAGDNVSVYYTGSFANGTVFGSNMGSTPFSFIAGSNQMIPGFSRAVIGMKVGQIKNVTLSPSEAYGYFNSSLVLTVNASVFRNESIHDGEQVYNGISHGVIMAINGTNITGKLNPSVVVNGTNSTVWGNYTKVSINFNSPLVGDTLNFEIKIAAINN